MRIIWVLLMLTLMGFHSGCENTSSKKQVLRVGYQKWGTFSLLKIAGVLEKAAASTGGKIEWIEFPSGPPLMEALNAGSIDVGHTGDSPPIFAQAAGIPFVYFGVSSPSPESYGIVVKESETASDATGLKGKRIGFTKGTSAHAFVLRWLEHSGMSFEDIVPVYLSPADARLALENGSIDAWAIWDPFLAAIQTDGGYRLVSSGKGFVDGREYYLASRELAERQPKRLAEFRSAVTDVKDWAKSRPDELSQYLSDATGIPRKAIELAESRRNRYDTEEFSDALVASQQALADRFLAIGLLPKKIDVRGAVFRPLEPTPLVSQ